VAKEIVIDFRELAALIVRENKVTEGHWGIWVRFAIAGINAGPDKDHVMPAAVVPIQEIGIQRFDKPNNLTVDAAKIWGASTRGKAPKSTAGRSRVPKAKGKK
jgi:hypothetical protein